MYEVDSFLESDYEDKNGGAFGLFAFGLVELDDYTHSEDFDGEDEE
jgi:hypothetical protein